MQNSLNINNFAFFTVLSSLWRYWAKQINIDAGGMLQYKSIIMEEKSFPPNDKVCRNQNFSSIAIAYCSLGMLLPPSSVIGWWVTGCVFFIAIVVAIAICKLYARNKILQ